MVEDDREYQLIVAKRNRGGIAPRSRLKGRQIKTKTQFFVRTGDFLIANRQIIHGACGTVPPEMNGALVSGEYTVLHAKNGLWLPFFSYFSHTVYFQQTCFHASIGVDIEKMVFKIDWWLKHRFHLPPLDEQKQIVEILATWDDEIDRTKSLVDANKLRKKSLTRLLLTGKKRLPGFTLPWKRSPLAEIADIRFSNVDKKSHDGERPIRLCNYLDVYNNEIVSPRLNFMRGTALPREIEKFSLKTGDVLVTKDSETAEDIAGSSVVSEDMPDVLCGYHLALLRPHHGILDGSFLSMYLRVDSVHNQFVRMANGVTRFGLSTSAFERAVIRYPDLKEQHSIAGVLHTADEELQLLQRRLLALEKQKRGLMENLLTGEARVKA